MYLTFYRRNEHFKQVSFQAAYQAYLEGTYTEDTTTYPRTHTVKLDTVSISSLKKDNMEHIIRMLLQEGINVPVEYEAFLIPKRSGGTRRIDAPVGPLKEYQRKVYDVFTKQLKLLSHDAAFGYITRRSCKHAIELHQKNRWFLKIDLKDFFPSITQQLLVQNLTQLYPFSMLSCYTELDLILHKCMLNGSLPQGSPASPLLSNLVMVPYDYEIRNQLRDFDGHNFTYTRYADDLLISASHDFHWRMVRDVVFNILPAQLQINQEKIRYGSNSGRNWNLGLMLGAQQRITVGHRRKERAKVLMHHLYTKTSELELKDLQIMQGEFAYIDSIEPGVPQKWAEKYQSDYKVFITGQIKSRQ